MVVLHCDHDFDLIASATGQLGGGGPPPEAMTSAMNTVADFLPLTHVTRAIQEPWLGLGNGVDHLLLVVAVTAATTALWVWRARAEQSI